MRLKNKCHLAVLILVCVVSSKASFATPSITSLSPTSAAVGASVTITGANFGGTQGTSTVTFNGTTATTITSWGASSIVATVPTGATTGGVVVTVGGVASNSVNFIVAAANFTLTGSLANARMFHTATLLNSGTVLVAGGVDGFAYDTISSAELYNPATGAFTATGSLNAGRIFNTSTLLANGQVLVAGGSDSNWDQIGSAELYNPTSGTFAITGSLTTARTGHSATLLNSGRVLIAGGWNSNGDNITSDAASSELYDPTSGAFASTGSLNTARDTHTATLLNDGRVLIVGGFDSNSNTLSSAELYDPVAGTFTLTGNLNVGRAVHTATLLNNGMVLIAGGYDINGNAVPGGELYDPSTGSFTLTGSMNTPRYDGAQGTVLNNGMVLLAGGQDNNGNTLASAELYDPATGVFSLTASMNTTRQSLTTTLLNNGQVLVTAGMDFNADVLNSAELYQPSTLIPAGLVSIVVSPSNPLVPVGATQLFTATGTFSDNSTQTLDSVTWTSSDNTVAAIADDVSDHGRALAFAPGSVTVSACTGSLCGSTTITVLGSPSVTSLSPTSGAVGTSVMIAGTNFGPAQGTSTVTFNGTPATPSSWSASSIVVPVPGGATTGSVVVTVSGIASNGVSFVVELTPVIANLSPTAGLVGTSVTITGANFGSTQNASAVTFNGTLATPASWSATSIVVSVPTGATSGPLSVTANGQTAYSPFFTVGTLPGTWLDVDVGAVGLAGSSSYTNGKFTVSGAGSQFSGTADAFHFVYQPLSGDGSIVARVTMPFGTGAEAGVMIRESLDGASANGNTIVPSGAIVEFNARTAPGGNTSLIGTVSAALAPYWVKLVRSGSTLSSYASADGVNWTLVGNQTVNMTPTVYIGLVVASGTAAPTLSTATFDNVSVSSSTTPAPVIASVSATTGTIGSTAVITGSNFGASQVGSVVTLNATPVIVNSWSNTSISITIPAGATSGLLVVSVAPTMNDSNPVVFTVTSQSLPSGWLDEDVGAVGVAGNSSYTDGVFAVSGAGGQFSGTADAFHFVYQPLSGDGSIVARVVSVPVGEGASAGVMMRETLDSASANGATVDFVVYGGVVEFNVRTAGRGSTSQLNSVGGTTPPYWVELVRSGSSLSSYASPDGVNWTLVGNQTVNMAQNVYVGLVSNSGNTSSLATATFDNVSVSSLGAPAPVITSVSATTGTIGSTVVITGSNFGASQGGSVVTLNAIPAIINSWSNTSISITIPSGTSSGLLVVSVAPSMNDSNPIEFTVTSQPLLSGWLDGDVGAVGTAGNGSYANGTFTVNGAGSQNSSTSDAFHFVYQPLSGNGSIVARVVTMPSGSAEAGVMIRETLDPGSMNGATVENVPGGAYVAFNVRTATDGNTSQPNSAGGTMPPYWVELVRSGSTLSSYASPDGANWTQVGSQTVNMAQNVDVGLVVNSGNTSSLATATFDNVAASFSPHILGPSITNLSPNVAVPNASVTITGANFGATQGTSTVTFNGTAGTPVNWSATSIVVLVPTGSTTGNVVVTVGGVASNGVPFTVSPAASIAGLSSASGTVGASITVTGVNFGSIQGTSTVAFNGTAGAPTSWSATSIVVPVPSGATTGNVVVTVGGLASNGVPFTVFPTPSITSLSTASATIGASVTITGTNFGVTQGASTVTFNGMGGTPASWSPTTIVVPVPLGSTTGNVVVTVNGISSNPVSMTVVLVSLPAVTQVQPANGTTGFPENGRVIVRFAQPLQRTAVVSGTIALFQGVNSIVGTLTLSNDGLSVTFIPARDLPANATVTVTVTDVTENQTVPEFQSSFTTGSSTDTVFPTLVQSSPQNDTTGVPINAPIEVQFSKPIDPGTLTPQAFTVTDNVSGSVPGMIQVDPTGTTASFVPQGFLGVGRTFAVGLSSAVEDSSGNSLEGATNFGFTTAFSADSTAPQMLGMSPLNGASAVPLNAVIVLEFSKPLDVISVSNGLQVASGGQPVPGGIALSNSNQQVTFTPQGGLAANTTYTVVTTSQITDVGALALSNPGTFSLTTGAVSDTTTPSVSSVSPGNVQTEVPINGVVQLQFSKAVDPWTVTSATFQVTNVAGLPVPGSVAASTDGLTATLTPSGQLGSFTTYYVQATSGITDVEGHGLSSFESTFTTGSATDSSAPTVLIVSPANGANGVPANVRVDLAMSAPLSAASVGSNAVMVSAGGVPVPGTVTLSSSGTILTFVSTNLLAASTTYTVTASGFTDQAGNAVVPFTSSFTTGTSAAANTTAPTVVTVSPVNGASAVSVSSPIVLTFNEAVDATTVNDTTAPISVNGAVLAGSYALDGTGTGVTFTPLSPLPGSMTVTVQVNSGLLDLSGNASNAFSSTFTTGTGTDTMPPVVTLVTPQNESTGIGPNAVVVLTFSKSLNPGTINANNFALLANGTAVAISISTSADNEVVTLTPYGLPVSSTITVLATNGVTDLSGNALASFQSQFTTGPAVNVPAPTVVSQRPANGASGVPLGANVVLYLSEPMNAPSVQAAVQVSQNGALVGGTTQVTDNGQVVQFTPSAPWQASALVQVFLTPTAQSVGGNSANSYQASFTTIPNPSTTAPVLIATNPVTLANAVPTNVVVNFAFNEALDPTALTPETVSCYQNGNWFQSGLSLLNGGTVLQVTPRVALAPNASTNCQLGNGIQGVNGLPLSSFSSSALSFTTGAGPDTLVPTIVTASPPNGSSNVGDNAVVRLVFSKPINPLTVNASTIHLSGGGVNPVLDSISFSNNNQSALLVPHTPLPDGTQMTLTISGVTDVAGNAVAAQTTQFTTRTGPDVVPPAIVMATPFQGAQNVPINAIVILQMSQPVDPGTVNSSTLTLVNGSNGQTVAGSYSVSADGLTITFVPGAPLTANSGYAVNFPGAGGGTGIADLAGNSLGTTYSVNFTTGAIASANAPGVVGVSPANATTAVPINAQVVIQFNEPVNAAKLSGVTLSAGSGTVNVSQSVTNGNQRLTLVPIVPLSPSTAYTLTIGGIQDFSGNVLPSPVTVSFTTGTGADLSLATVASVNPASNATGVSASTAVTVNFSKTIDPLTVTTGTMQLIPTSTSIPVAGIVSSNGGSATFTPNEPLDLMTQYFVQLTTGVTDMEGHSLQGGSFNSYFTTTGQGTPAEPPAIASVVQASGFVGTPVLVNGTYFGTSQGNSTLTFNGVEATPTTWTDTQISVPVPSGATSGPVVVTVNGVASNGFAFNVDATSTITSISPGSGAAGTTVTITGTNLGDAQDSIMVDFEGLMVPASSANETSLTVTVPAAAPPGTYNLTVYVNGYPGAGMSFTVIPTPTISLVNPNSGVAGTPVVISGNNFGFTQGSSTITFNGAPAASITYWSNTYISAVPPSNVTTGPVVVVANSVTSTSTNNIFTVTNPAIGSILPPAAAAGALVTINGSGFQLGAQQTIQVLFNGVSYTPNQFSPTSVIAEVPNNATSGPVTVVVGGVTSNSVNFTVEQPPTITSFSPTGPLDSGGHLVPLTITGSGFGATQSNSTVNFFGSSTAPTIISWSETSITLWPPYDAATGPLYVQVAGLNAFAPSWYYLNTVTKLTDSFGNQSQYNLGSLGGLWFPYASQGPGCVTCTLRGNTASLPDANGNPLSTTDDLNNTTTYTYDSNNNMTSASKPLDSNTTVTTSYTYNSLGEVLTATDPLGNTTVNTYDAHGNLLTVTSPAPNSNTAASVTQFQYNTLGELTQITDPKNNNTTLTYTPVGLIATITDAQSHTTSYQYDSRGDRTLVIDALQNQTSFSYDAMSRLTGITYPDHSTVSFTYDIRGRRITSTDQNNKTTTYTYDDADRLTAVTDPAQNTTQYAYDTEDNLLSITDANGHATQFAYNTRGWVTQTTFPSTLAEYYAYDLVGNLLSKTDRKGNTIQYLYDALYRLTQKTYPDTTNVEYAYDLANKVLQVNDPTGTYGFAYDNMGRLVGTSTQYAFLAGPTFTNSYTYDAASNRTSLTAPDGSISTYGYDSLNRLNGLANSWAGSFGFGYDALSRRTQLTRPNGVNTNYSYDSLSHLLSVLHQTGTNTLDGASYTYDPAGNRTSKGNYLNGTTSNYSYDPLYELTQVTQGGSTTESYSYDPVGNRLSSSGVPNYSYNASNELTSNSNGSYTYDANGNTLSDASGKSYTWDFENRLTQAVKPGVGTTTFRYDPFGRRIQKSGPLGTTNYLYDWADSIEEVDQAGNELAHYVRTSMIDEPLSEARSSITSFYQADGLGSVTSLSGLTSALTSTYVYDSYGRLSSSSGTLTNPFQYAGRESDPETNLYYYRARYLDGSIGRFVSEDPIGFNGGDDFYAYVGNHPVSFSDPTGLKRQIGGPTPAYNCLAWGLGLNWVWVQPTDGRSPNGVLPSFGCKQIDCKDDVKCKLRAKVKVFEDSGDPFNWHVERQTCDNGWTSKYGKGPLDDQIADPDADYNNAYPPKGKVKSTCWSCPVTPPMVLPTSPNITYIR